MDFVDSEKYQLLVSADDASFGELYRIYAESMTLREQKPRAVIAKMVGRSDYKVLLQKKSDVVIGFSILFVPEKETFRLLEYMAVERGFRNSGAGSRLFSRVLQDSVSPRGERLPLLLEVDSDREASADREMRRRRQQFYRRLGCWRVQGLAYILPLPGEGAPPEMDLMMHAPADFISIRKAQLRHWLEAIYAGVYDCAPGDCAPGDPRIAQMMAGVSDPVTLE